VLTSESTSDTPIEAQVVHCLKPRGSSPQLDIHFGDFRLDRKKILRRAEDREIENSSPQSFNR
jgi:hypothetical protein